MAIFNRKKNKTQSPIDNGSDFLKEYAQTGEVNSYNFICNHFSLV